MTRTIATRALLTAFFLCFSYVVGAQGKNQMVEDRGLTFSEIQVEATKLYNLDGEIKRPGWKQYRRWEWLARTRLDSSGRYNPALTWQRWLGKPRRGSGRHQPDLARWNSVGPATLPTLPTNGIPGMGRLNCVTFDPVDNNIIWVGSPSGGVWRSLDYGQTWANLTDHLPNIGASDILINPTNPRIMYLALGDGDAGLPASIGVIKSTDRGRSWQMTGLSRINADGWMIHKLVMKPDDPNSVFAVTSTGIYLTSDAGATWERKLSGRYPDLEVNPANPNIWYATRFQNGVFRSTDDGETWSRLGNGLPTAGFSTIKLAMSPSSPQTLYASYAEDGVDFYSGYGFLGLYRSLDGGDSWTLRSSSPNVFGNALYGPSEYSLGSYANVLKVAPSDPDTVILGSVNLWKSTDGGLTWSYITDGDGGFAFAPAVHVDHHELTFLPGSDEILFDCNDGGLYRSDDAGTTWIDLSEGLAIRQIYRLSLSPHSPEHFVFGAQDNGTDHFNGEWQNIMPGDGMNCFFDPNNPAVIYASLQEGALFRSDDNGRNWIDISGRFSGQGAWLTPFMMDPVHSSTIFMALKSVYKSVDRGQHWTALGGQLSNENLTDLGIAPSDPSRMLASDGNLLFHTTTVAPIGPASTPPKFGTSYLISRSTLPIRLWSG